VFLKTSSPTLFSEIASSCDLGLGDIHPPAWDFSSSESCISNNQKREMTLEESQKQNKKTLIELCREKKLFSILTDIKLPKNKGGRPKKK
jgi:hypothetical protein